MDGDLGHSSRLRDGGQHHMPSGAAYGPFPAGRPDSWPCSSAKGDSDRIIGGGGEGQVHGVCANQMIQSPPGRYVQHGLAEVGPGEADFRHRVQDGQGQSPVPVARSRRFSGFHSETS